MLRSVVQRQGLAGSQGAAATAARDGPGMAMYFLAFDVAKTGIFDSGVR